jgi:hypothetical protein
MWTKPDPKGNTLIVFRTTMPSSSPPTSSAPARHQAVSTSSTCVVLHDIDAALGLLYPPARTSLPPFHRRLLLVTGLTQLADALALMLLPFLASEVACGWLGGDPGSAAVLSTGLFAGMLVGALGGGYVSDRCVSGVTVGWGGGGRVGHRFSAFVRVLAAYPLPSSVRGHM